jgi:hypothetical protein
MQKKIVWKRVAYFFVGWRTLYCASEEFSANRLVTKDLHGQGHPQNPEKSRRSIFADRHHAESFATTSANQYPAKTRKTP